MNQVPNQAPGSVVPDVHARFKELTDILHNEGVYSGTGHKRIVIPKDKLTDQDVHDLGFVPVTIAIPEAGQDRFSSFRHPDMNYHIHSHPEGWTMHEDQHAASTMLASKEKTLGKKTKALISGLPHVNEEGIPGLYYYVKGRLAGHNSTAQSVLEELSPETKAKIQGMAPSPTFHAPEVHAPVLKAAEAFKLQGHIDHQGIPVAVENRKGSVRSGVDRDGKPWRTKMIHPYGYIKGTKGADGDEVDAYVGPVKDAPHAFVVHQHKDDGTGYDEDKVMLGFASKEDAVKGYLAHYNSRKFLGPVKKVPVERLKELIAEGKTMKKISAPTIPAFFLELAKLGTISDEQALQALDRYDALEKNKPTLPQVGRYAAIGAAAGPVMTAVGNAIRGGRSDNVSLLSHLAGASGPGVSAAARGLAGSALTGALSAGAVPLLRQHVDQRAELGTIQKYLHEKKHDAQTTSPGKLTDPFEPVKEAFASSQYDAGLSPPTAPQVSGVPPFRRPDLRAALQKVAAGAPTRGNFMQASEVPPFRAPSLQTPVQKLSGNVDLPYNSSDFKPAKLASSATTPMGRLASAKQVGLPKVTAPSGPSIAQVAKPIGFGKPAAGATKSV